MSTNFQPAGQVQPPSQEGLDNNGGKSPPLQTSQNFRVMPPPLPVLQAGRGGSTQAFIDNSGNIAHVLSPSFTTAGLVYTLADNPVELRLISPDKDEKNIRPNQGVTRMLDTTQNQTLNGSQFQKFATSSGFTQTGSSTVIKSEPGDLTIALPEEKRMSPLSLVPVTCTYQDQGQPSPASSTQSNTQPMRFQPAGNTGDAMLSAINYNENEILPDSTFDVAVPSNLTTLDEGILANMGPPVNMRLPENSSSSTFDLFDGEGNVNDSYNMETLSPQTLQESSANFGSGVSDGSNLGGIPDTDSGTSNSAHGSRHPGESATNSSRGGRGKGRPTKAQGIVARQIVQCPICSKAFNNSSALAKHKLTHSDERKYVCQICSKAFKRQDHLNGHLMTHRDKKPYECQFEGCEKSYCDARSLRRHHENHHQHSGEVSTVAVIPTTTGPSAVQMAPVTNQSLNFQTNAENGLFTDSNSTSRIHYAPPPYNANHTPEASPHYNNTQPQYFQFDTSQQQQQQQHSQQQQFQPSENNQAWQQDPGQLFKVNQFVSQGPVMGAQTTHSPQNGERSPSYLQQISPISPAPVPNQTQPTSPMHNIPRQTGTWYKPPNSNLGTKASGDEAKPVKCSLCHRRFKNIPALNGHMRLHGGYFKKNGSGKDNQKKSKKHMELSTLSLPTEQQQTPPQLPAGGIQGLNQAFQPNDQTSQPSQDEANIFQRALGQQMCQDSISSMSSQQHQLLQRQLQLPTIEQLQEQHNLQAFQDQLNQQFQQEHLQAAQLQQLQPPLPQLPSQEQQPQVSSAQELSSQSQQSQDYHSEDIKHTFHQENFQPMHSLHQIQSTIQQALDLPQTLQPADSPVGSSANVTLDSGLHPIFSQPPSQSIRLPMIETLTSQHIPTQSQPSFICGNQLSTAQIAFTQFLPSMATFSTSVPTTTSPQHLQDVQLTTNDLTRSANPEQINFEGSSISEGHSLPPQLITAHQSQLPPLSQSSPTSQKPSINNSIELSKQEIKDPYMSSASDVSLFPFPAPSTSLQFDTNSMSTNAEDIPEQHDELEGSSNLDRFKTVELDMVNRKRKCLGDIQSSLSPKRNLTDPANLNFLLRDTGIMPLSIDGESLQQNKLSIQRFQTQSKTSEDHKLQRSKSEDHTFMRPRNRIEDVPYRPKSRTEDPVTCRWRSHPDETLSRTEGAGFFRNPNLGTSPVRSKRKNRPAPLIIPPYVSNSGFHSRLRSPRIRDGNEIRNGSPPPYTPPPMLSPVRSGSGLFWNIPNLHRPSSPRSAPIPFKLSFSSSRRTSMGLMSAEKITEEPDEETDPPPETDILPHVNVGPMFQAELPFFNANKKMALMMKDKEDLVWHPFVVKEKAEEEVQCYQEFACCAAVKWNGSNVEYALHLLFLAQGNIQNALIMLMGNPPKLSKNHTLLTFDYQECENWTSEEIEAYNLALMKCDKDFFRIANEVKSKTVKQCIQFYYLWKKVCPEEYKRLRAVRRKRENDELYNLRSKQRGEQEQQAEESDTESSVSEKTDDQNEKEEEEDSSSTVALSPASIKYACDFPDCNEIFVSRQALNGHVRIHGKTLANKGASEMTPPVHHRGPGRPPLAPAVSLTAEYKAEKFPCKLCGKVFTKIKSRCAHMKIHRITEAERKGSKYDVTPDG